MSQIIDRRVNGKNKSAVNRQKFIRRYKKHLKKAVEDAVTKRSITDMERGENVNIPARDGSWGSTERSSSSTIPSDFTTSGRACRWACAAA